MRMARVNVYLPDELHERVKSMDGVNISAACQRALEQEVARMTTIQELREGMERIELDMGNHDVAFNGQWLVVPDDFETRADDPTGAWDAGAYYGVALTGKGKIAVYAAHCNQRWEPHFETYATIEAARIDMPQNIYLAAKEALGDRAVLELDI